MGPSTSDRCCLMQLQFMKKLFAVYLRVRQKNSSGTEEDRYRRKCCSTEGGTTGPAADRKTLDAKVRREHLTSCLKEPAAASSFADFQTGGCVLSALSGRLRDPFTVCWDISTWQPQSHYYPGLCVSLADQVFRPHVCLLLLSLSLSCPPLSAWAELIFGARPWPTHLV